MRTYIYKGAVKVFDKCVCWDFFAQTKAISKAKAKSNIIYQFKKQYGYQKHTVISLVGDIKEVM